MKPQFCPVGGCDHFLFFLFCVFLFGNERRKLLMGNQMWWNLRSSTKSFDLPFFSPAVWPNQIFTTFLPIFSQLLPVESNFCMNLFPPNFLFTFLQIFAVSGANQISAHSAAQKPEREIFLSRSRSEESVDQPGFSSSLQIDLIFQTIKTCWLFIKISHFRGNIIPVLHIFLWVL